MSEFPSFLQSLEACLETSNDQFEHANDPTTWACKFCDEINYFGTLMHPECRNCGKLPSAEPQMSAPQPLWPHELAFSDAAHATLLGTPDLFDSELDDVITRCDEEMKPSLASVPVVVAVPVAVAAVPVAVAAPVATAVKKAARVSVKQRQPLDGSKARQVARESKAKARKEELLNAKRGIEPKPTWEFSSMLKGHERVWWTTEKKWSFRIRFGSKHPFTDKYCTDANSIMSQQHRCKDSDDMKAFVIAERARIEELGGLECYAAGIVKDKAAKRARRKATTQTVIPTVRPLALGTCV